MADDLVELVVNGKRYSGWKSVRITRSIESLAGSFSLDVSDRWDGETAPWPIFEGDECQIEIGGVSVIDGFVGKRNLSADKQSRSLSYEGRDRAGLMVDCSAVLSKWTYRNVDLEELASTLANPFGVTVAVQSGLALTKLPKIAISPGDTAYEAFRKAADAEGVILVSDGNGGVLITRAGSARAAALVEGQNIEKASVGYDGDSRFYKYIVATQIAGTDKASGDATRIQAQAIDEGVTRTERVLLIRPLKGYSTTDARKRADWEARIRAAKAETVTVEVQGWRQPNGKLWPLNALVHVKAPRLVGVDGDMLISQVEHTVGDGGQMTQLRLMRPDAFTPEPVAAKVSNESDFWKNTPKPTNQLAVGKNPAIAAMLKNAIKRNGGLGD